MNSIDFLKERFSKLFTEFNLESLRYEYIQSEKTHIVEVKPEETLMNDEFAIANLNLDDEFSEKYPLEDLIFLSLNSINKVNTPILHLPKNNSIISYKNYFSPSDAFMHYDNTIFNTFLNSIKTVNVNQGKAPSHFYELSSEGMTEGKVEENYALAA